MKHIIIYTHWNPNSFTKTISYEMGNVLPEKDEGIFGFCEMTLKTTFFNNVAMWPDEERKSYL